MPKIRDHKRPAKQTFLVSPWQSKRERNTTSLPDASPAAVTSAATATAPGPCMYSVMTSEALLVPSSHKSTTVAPVQQQGPEVACVAHSPPHLSLQSSGGWHTRPKHPTTASLKYQAAAAAAVRTACQLDASAAKSPSSHHHGPSQQQQHQEQQQQEQQQCQRQHKRQCVEQSAAGAAGSSSTSDMSADATDADDDSDSIHEADTASQGGYQAHTSTQLLTETQSDDWLDAETPAAATAAAAAADGCLAGDTRGPATLEGAAQLVLHPSGHISGHLIALSASSNNSNSSGSSNSGHGVNAALSAGQGPRGQPAGSSTAAVHSPDRQHNSSSSSSSMRVCLGLQGKQVLGIHSCYRDPEWALLQLSIIRHNSSSKKGSSSGGHFAVPRHDAALAAAGGGAVCVMPAAGDTKVKVEPAATQEPGLSAAAAAAAAEGPGSSSSGSEAEAVAWVQRKGGDLVTLEPADFDDEDTEAAVLAENLGELPANVTVNFTAHKLLCGAVAAGVLRDSWPELVGQPDVVVNIGDMSISGLPAGFLQGL